MKDNNHFYYYNNGIQGYKTYAYGGIRGLKKPATTPKDIHSYKTACYSQKGTIDLQRSVLACNRFADNTAILSSYKIGNSQVEQLTTVRGLFY